MYVPGTLNDVEHVLINVGTGYYVEKVGESSSCLSIGWRMHRIHNTSLPVWAGLMQHDCMLVPCVFQYKAFDVGQI